MFGPQPPLPRNNKNFMKSHLKDLRNLESQVRDKKEQENKNQDEPFKSKKYQNVQSRVVEDTENKVIQRRNTYEGFKNAAAHSLNLDPTTLESNRKSKAKGGSVAQGQDWRDVPTYDVDELEKKTPQELDMILRQMDAMSKATYSNHSQLHTPKNRDAESTKMSQPSMNDQQRKPPRSFSKPPIPNHTQSKLMPSDDPKHRNYGKVPKYLQDYKNEKDQLDREIQKEMEKKICPPGTRLLDEEERLRMVQELQANRTDVINQIERMPITTKTMSMQKRRDELDEKLRGIEKNIELFSRKKVFVAM